MMLDIANKYWDLSTSFWQLPRLSSGVVFPRNDWQIPTMGTAELLKLIEDRCRDLNLAEGQLSRTVAGHGTAVTDIRRGRSPSAERLEKICEALGLEFYVGPPREPLDHLPIPLRDLERSTRDLVRLTTNAGGDPIPDDLWPVLAVRHGGGVPFAANENVPGARPINVVEFAAAAGDGAEAFDEAVSGRVWFRRDWLDNRGLDPTQCAVIGVRGDSMCRTLPDGCSILVDRQRTELVDKAIFVVRAEDGLVVKRACQAGSGEWTLVSEHRSWPPLAWSAVVEVIGRVVWMARVLE